MKSIGWEIPNNLDPVESDSYTIQNFEKECFGHTLNRNVCHSEPYYALIDENLSQNPKTNNVVYFLTKYNLEILIFLLFFLGDSG